MKHSLVSILLFGLYYVAVACGQQNSPAVPVAGMEDKNRKWAELTNAEMAIRGQVLKLTAKDARDLFLNPADEKAKIHNQWLEQFWPVWIGADPCKGAEDPDQLATFVDPRTILKDLNLDTPPQNEKVSLRKDFEAFGINPVPQGELDGCELHAAHKLMNFWLAKRKLNKISVNEFCSSAIKAYPTRKGFLDGVSIGGKRLMATFQLSGTLALYTKERPKVTSTMLVHPALSEELVKHLLRKGRPLFMRVKSNMNNGFSHMAVLTGFETTDGKTKYECLDSQYYTVDKILPGGDSLCYWYE